MYKYKKIDMYIHMQKMKTWYNTIKWEFLALLESFKKFSCDKLYKLYKVSNIYRDMKCGRKYLSPMTTQHKSLTNGLNLVEGM